MPPTQEMIERAAQCLDRTVLETFAASPPTVRPFGPGSQLTWKAELPESCLGLALRLNGVPVPSSGTRAVQPSATTTYRLEASMFTVKSLLGTATVAVDTRGCISGSIPEPDVRAAVQKATDAFDTASRRVSQRSPAAVQVESKGITVRLRMKVTIDNFSDPDLNIDLTLGLRARNGQISPSYRSFSVDVDWPWWITAATVGVSEIIEEVLAGEIEGQLKPKLLEAVKETIDGFVRLVPRTHGIYSIATVPDQINIMVCPVMDALAPVAPNTRNV